MNENNDTRPPRYNQRHFFIQTHPESDYLLCSMFNLFCCFFWLGIPAVYYSTKARDHYHVGDFTGGRQKALTAKMLNIIGIAIGSVAVAIILILIIVFN